MDDRGLTDEAATMSDPAPQAPDRGHATEAPPPAVPGTATRVIVENTTKLDCPGCSTVVEVRLPAERRADEFCPECDYPLFFAPQIDIREEEEHDTARVAGSLGFESAVSEPCPVCSEPNTTEAIFCTRCGSMMHPPDEPEPEPEPEQVAIVVPIPMPVSRVIVAAVLVAVVAVAAVLWSAPWWWLRVIAQGIVILAAIWFVVWLRNRKRIEIATREDAEAEGHVILEDYELPEAPEPDEEVVDTDQGVTPRAVGAAPGRAVGAAPKGVAAGGPAAAAAGDAAPAPAAPATAAPAAPSAPAAAGATSAAGKAKEANQKLKAKKMKAHDSAQQAKGAKAKVENAPMAMRRRLALFDKLKRLGK